jgi:hypothetical protein
MNRNVNVRLKAAPAGDSPVAPPVFAVFSANTVPVPTDFLCLMYLDANCGER